MTVQANVAALFVTVADAAVLKPPEVEVRIDGAVEPRVRLDVLEHRMGEATRARFSAGLGRDPATGEQVSLEELAPWISPGRTVTATLLRGGIFPGVARADLVLFEGRIGPIELSLKPEGEGLRFEAQGAAAELLRRRVGGQRAWGADGQAARLEGLPLVFNPDGRPNAATVPYDPGTGHPYTVFAPDAPAGAAAWTLDEALAYLLAEYGTSADVAVPTPAEVRAAVDAIVIRDVSLEGQTLAGALDALLELAGGQLVVAAEPTPTGVSRRLEIWYPGRAPFAWFSHQRQGERHVPQGTDLAALAVQMHFDQAPRRYVARGDRKFYESTFDLVAGWDDSSATYDPDDFSPSTNPDFGEVRDVFRKWVLNEAAEYSESPYGRGPAPDLTALFEEAPYVRRHRRLLPCLSRDALGRSYGVYAEVSLDAGVSWQQMSLDVRVLTGECGLYLADDPLPPHYLAAAMRGQVRVHVTATVESDSRLVVEHNSDAAGEFPGRTRHLHVPAGYRFRQVAPTSRFHGQADADEVDDTARLEELVAAAHEADRRSPAPTRIETPYLAMGHRVGERVLGVRGRRLDLARQHEGYTIAPVVERIRYTFAPVPRTELILE